MSFIEKLKRIFSLKHAETGEENDAVKFDGKMPPKFDSLARNCIDVKFFRTDTEGLSHFGGRPVVPENFEWPYFVTDSFDDPASGTKARPLAFLAQFDCGALAEYDKEGLLPHSGALCFFYSVESNCWGFDPQDCGCARVYWFEDVNSLYPAEFPEDLPEQYRFPSLAMKFAAKDSYPDFEELPEGYDSDEYFGFFESVCSDDGSVTKLLGWADVIQSEMVTECELVTQGFYLGGSEKIPEKALKEAERSAANNWRLLFQMDTVASGDFELMFGDCGKIYFWIRKDDLLARRFDRVWLILQCG